MPGTPVSHSPEIDEILRVARLLAVADESAAVSPKHLLLSLIACDFRRLMAELDASLEAAVRIKQRYQDENLQALQEADQIRARIEVAVSEYSYEQSYDLLSNRNECLERANFLSAQISKIQEREAELLRSQIALIADRRFEVAYLLQFAGLSGAAARYIVEQIKKAQSEKRELSALPPLSPKSVSAWLLTKTKTQRYGHEQVLPVFLLAALVTNFDPQDSAIQLLDELRIDVPALRRKTDVHIKFARVQSTPPQLGSESKTEGEVEVEVKSKTHDADWSNSWIAFDPAAKIQPDTQMVAKRRSREIPSNKTMFDWFDWQALEIIQAAQEIARNSGVVSIGLEHMLWAMSRIQTPASSALQKVLSKPELESRLFKRTEQPIGNLEAPLFTMQMQKALTRAHRGTDRLEEKMSARELILACIAEIFEEADMALLTSELRSSEEPTKLLTAVQELVSGSFFIEEAASSIKEEATKLIDTNITITVTSRVLRVLHSALQDCVLDRHGEVHPAYLILGILNEAERSEVDFVRSRQLNFDRIRLQLFQILEAARGTHTIADGRPQFGEAVRRLLAKAWQSTLNYRGTAVDINQLAMALLDLSEPQHKQFFLSQVGSNEEALRRRLHWCMLWREQQQLPVLVESLDLANMSASFPDQAPITVDEQRAFYKRRLSYHTTNLLYAAERESRRLGQHSISIEHIILAMLREKHGIVTVILCQEQMLSSADVRRLEQSLGRGNGRLAQSRNLSKKSLQIIEKAWRIADNHGKLLINPEHILLAIANEDDGLSAAIFECLNISGAALRESILQQLQTAPHNSAS